MSGRDMLLRVVLRELDDAQERLTTPRMQFEFRRKAFHVLGAIVAVPVLLLVPLLWAVAFAVFALVVIVVSWYVWERRFHLPPDLEGMEQAARPIGRAIEKTRREDEQFPWAPVSYILALIVVGLAVDFLGLPLSYAFAAYAILGVGDAASALIGIPYGRHKLAWNPGKSWEGLTAGLVAGFLGAVVLGAIYHAFTGTVFPPELLLVFFSASLAAMVVESVPGVQDNWAVPVASLGAMVATAYLVGLPVPAVDLL